MPIRQKEEDMILDNKKIQSLNIEMLGFGAPIERDGVGYNKPDWASMVFIGHYLPLFPLLDRQGSTFLVQFL